MLLPRFGQRLVTEHLDSRLVPCLPQVHVVLPHICAEDDVEETPRDKGVGVRAVSDPRTILQFLKGKERRCRAGRITDDADVLRAGVDGGQTHVGLEDARRSGVIRVEILTCVVGKIEPRLALRDLRETHVAVAAQHLTQLLEQRGSSFRERHHDHVGGTQHGASSHLGGLRGCPGVTHVRRGAPTLPGLRSSVSLFASHLRSLNRRVTRSPKLLLRVPSDS
mmetsp:Transcript_18494/g.49595  ORF Transcript_18494/g.49595 Transcript_18494/m.49595 type:complete len:222 (-) Transcript_18494:18-683(-)